MIKVIIKTETAIFFDEDTLIKREYDIHSDNIPRVFWNILKDNGYKNTEVEKSKQMYDLFR